MGQPGVPGPAAPASNGLGVAALVVGIVAFLLAFLLFPIGALLGIVAVVLGVAGRRKAKRGEATNGGLATAGLVLGALALLVAVVIGLVLGKFLADNADTISDCAQLPQAEQQACIEERLEQ
ncbi:MAG: DUF4190 domain-containing protein [Actinomycetota bacterium]|nr:DUF4190 domain-containing protein [Actinomycetota bacterium]